MSPDSDNLQDRDQGEGSPNYHDSDHESSTDGQRAGRFYGPDSSWRYYTENERAVASSLQQSENNELSLALYNVHAMRVRTRGSESISAARPWHSKNRWIQPTQDRKIPFQPPPKWTAWPLKPGTVPRSREVWGVSAAHSDDEAETYSNVQPWKPSLDLQEQLKAGFLRQAKDRFNKRQSEDDYLNEHKTSPGPHSTGPSGITDDKGQDEEQAKLEESQSTFADVFPPLFMADDDAASVILQPTVRHTITKYDDLLAALHQSRQGHSTEHASFTRTKRRASILSGSMARSETSNKSTRKRKRVVSDFVQLNATSEENHVTLDSTHRSARKLRRQHKRLIGQRDWSEVLGIAAMSGWEPSVIDRAARRCAAIFGETMSIRFMSASPAKFSQDRVVDYVPDMIPRFEEGVEVAMEEDPDEAVNACPHMSCKRHSEPYELRWRLREHLKRDHHYSAQELESWKAEAIDRGRATASLGDKEEDNDMGELDVAVKSERDDFLQPITIRVGRSRDKRPRASASRSRSRKAVSRQTLDEDTVGGSGSAMSTDSGL